MSNQEEVTVDHGQLLSVVEDLFATWCYHMRFFALSEFLERELRCTLNTPELRYGKVSVSYGRSLDTFGRYHDLILKAYLGIEAGLKLLLTRGDERHRNRPVGGHNFLALYKQLPKRMRQDLARKCAGEGFELEPFLNAHKSAYVDFRYLEKCVITEHMIANAYWVLRFCRKMMGNDAQCECVRDSSSPGRGAASRSGQ